MTTKAAGTAAIAEATATGAGDAESPVERQGHGKTGPLPIKADRQAVWQGQAKQLGWVGSFAQQALPPHEGGNDGGGALIAVVREDGSCGGLDTTAAPLSQMTSRPARSRIRYDGSPAQGQTPKDGY